ncbi:MAG: hypothetical protein HY722_04200 [Planctomycetes bacterium]|nr:hypothetical protein [Planctomycetota bacterium]
MHLDTTTLDHIREQASGFLREHVDLRLVGARSTADSLHVEGRLKFLSVWWEFDFDSRLEVGRTRLVLHDMDVSARYALAGAFASAFVLPAVLEECVRRLRRARVKGISYRGDRLTLDYAPFLRSVLLLGRGARADR